MSRVDKTRTGSTAVVLPDPRGERLFELACERDLEGIVAKWSKKAYQCDRRATSWLKIKNPAYSQMENRRELFESRRHSALSSRRAHTVSPALVLR